MIQFYVSKGLAKVLGPHLKPAKNMEPTLLWRAEVAQIGTDTCVVAQEVYSNYVMVFCGLGKDEFRRFPDIFRERFWREATALCLQGTSFDQGSLIHHLSALGEEQYYQLDPLPQEEGRITQVTEKLERLFLHDGEPLPIDGKSAFRFGIEVNGSKAKRAEASGKPSAMEAFRGLCLDLVEQMIEQDQNQESSNSAVISEVDNVVTVDFGRNRKAS